MNKIWSGLIFGFTILFGYFLHPSIAIIIMLAWTLMFKPWKKENGKKVATWHLSFLLGMILLITGLDYMGRPFQQCTYDHYFEQGTPNHNRWSEAVRKRIECEEKIKKVRELGSSNSEIQKLILELRNLEEKVHEAENRLLCVKTSIWSRKKE